MQFMKLHCFDFVEASPFPILAFNKNNSVQ